MAHRPIRLDSSLEELAPYMKMTVVPKVTVGDLGFSSAQSVFSTTYIKPAAVINTFAANIDADLFQSAIGDGGQGLAAGTVMTRGQTNWLDSNGRLSDNEVFIGIRAMFSVYKHTSISATGPSLLAADALTLIPSVAAVWQICKSLSWQYQIGDGIIRNCGALAGYPQGNGVWEAPITPAVVASLPALGAQNGSPDSCNIRELPIPFMFLPSISTKIKVISGSPLSLEPQGDIGSSTFSTSVDFLSIRLTIQGYKLTMPV